MTPKEILQKYISNYVFIIVVYVIFMFFFMPVNVQSIYKLSKIEDELMDEKLKYERDLMRAKQDKKDLIENIDNFARRKYFMHKENEDVYIIERK